MMQPTPTQISKGTRSRHPRAGVPLASGPQWPQLDPSTATVDIVVPCHNEAPTLARNIERMRTFVSGWEFGPTTVTIADSGSTDQTLEIAEGLARAHPDVRVSRQTVKGRGRALKAAWGSSRADILVYMDEDLSTDLRHLPELILPLVYGEAPLAVGSRRAPGARVERSAKREFLSRGYIWLLHRTLGLKPTDAQCGFKAIRRDAATRLLDSVEDDYWFFDTELIIKGQRLGWPVHEVAVTWREDTDSRVRLVRTVVDDVRGIDRLRREAGRFLTLERLAFGSLLGLTAVFYLWNLGINGYANSYYSAAVQAATVSWKAFFFGSLDAASYVTVDKPPAAIWAMALSTRLFGFSGWAMLLPNVLAGIGTVGLVYATVRRVFGVKEALIAGLVMAFTPVAALMFRFNNPDALLTLLLTASAYAVVRALASRRAVWWLVAAGGFTGLAFNTKMLQGLIVMPVLGLVYLLAARLAWPRRLLHLLAAGAATAVASLWWPVAVWLTPAADRPYIGSSSSNSIWDLILGYNGLGRLLGSGSGMGGALAGARTAAGGMMAAGGRGPGGTGFGGATGLWRMFNSDFGPNIAWFIPLALVTAGLVIWLTRRLPRTDRRRAMALLWGGWLALHIVVFSITSGVIHPYYPVVMAPAVAVLAGMGVPLLWQAWQRRLSTGWLLPLTVFFTSLTAFALLTYHATWLPPLRWIVLAAGLIASLGLAAGMLAGSWHWRKTLAGLALVATLTGPVAMSLATVAVAHTGSIPTAGPSATAMAGSNNETSASDPVLVAYLLSHRAGTTWLAATASANESAAIQLSSGQPVMAVGGFSGSDNVLTLDAFKALVAAGKLKYYVSGAGGRGGGPGGNNQIASWVQANATVVNYGGSSNVTLYQL